MPLMTPRLPRNARDYVVTADNKFYGTSILAPSLSSTATVADRLRGSVFYVREGYHIDRMQFEVATGLAGNMIVGIYSAKTDGTQMPDQLLLSGSEFSTAVAGIKEDTVDFDLEPDRLFWLMWTSDNVVVQRTITDNSVPNILGSDGGTGASKFSTLYNFTRIYDGTMPQTAEVSTVLEGNNVCYIGLRAVIP